MKRLWIVLLLPLTACSGSDASGDLFDKPPIHEAAEAGVSTGTSNGNCNGSAINAGGNVDCSSGKIIVASEPKFEWTSMCYQQGSLTCDVLCKQMGKQCGNKCSRQSSSTKDASVQLACAHNEYGCNYLTLQGSLLGSDACNQVIQPQGECSGEYSSPVVKCCCGDGT